MRHEPKIKKVLLVLSPDLIHNKNKHSQLIERAVSLAKITGCELELFHVCYDGELEYRLFESGADLKRQRKELNDRDSVLLAEVATRLKEKGINVCFDTRWDSSRTNAILRKVSLARPDIVMKQAGEHSYILGITSNTDWELARRSPAHVWFVNDKQKSINRIMAAIGNNLGDDGDVTTAADYDPLRLACLLGVTFNADIYPVNAYQISSKEAPDASVEEQNRLHAQIVKQHSDTVKAFAQYFNIAKDNVTIREGHPNKVIPELAESIAASAIVMGANSISRLERLFSKVTVEPVMAETNADIIIVRERDLSNMEHADSSPVDGVPNYDFEQAIANPQAIFDSPLDVANLPKMSIELCNRILQAWECDIRAKMVEENEGGPSIEIDVNALDEIISARALLEMRKNKPDKVQLLLHD